MRVSKEISDRAGVGRGNVSVAGAAADLAERVFGDLAAGRVLVVGAGETAELVLFHLQSRGVERFHVINRTPESAEELARRFAGGSGGLDTLPDCLPDADVLAASDGPTLNGALAATARLLMVYALLFSLGLVLSPR